MKMTMLLRLRLLLTLLGVLATGGLMFTLQPAAAGPFGLPDIFPTAPATASPTPTPVPVPPPSLPTLTVSGNKIMRNGSPFRFVGVNRDTLEWGSVNYDGCGGDEHFLDSDFDAVKSWRATAVRLPLAQQAWLGRTCPASAYQAMVEDAVRRINARGMYAILDLHWTDAQGNNKCDYTYCVSGQQPMPDADSIVFWRQVAQRYAGWSGVMFGLFNEPHDVSWSCWRDGGCDVTPSPGTGSIWTYKAAGMQQLYDAVRSQGAQNLVLVAGLDYAYDLSGISAGASLNGSGIVYDTHVYTAFHSDVTDWNQHFGQLAATYPVSASEFGTNDCSADPITKLLNYFDAPQGQAQNAISWTAWSWSAPGSCQQPSVINDWTGTPIGGSGVVIRDRMLALGMP
jgi:aryl-phospho-beta-D-glucosidase BglC (GH1 family)